MAETVVTLDVRSDLRQGHKPCHRILETVARLAPGQALRLITPFEPVPLFELLGQQGFGHQAKPIGAGDWEALFSRDLPVEPPASSAASAAGQAACGCVEVVEVDARGWEPPQPMVKILEALGTLPAGAVLQARTDRRPMHLYALLQARGFVGDSEEQTDGSWLTVIRRG
jgi:uncharacterized protein (DUF2249 family)